MPLDEMADKGVGYGGGVADYGPGREEVVPDFPNRTVVVAQFAGFDVVLSGSRSAIYTEMHLSVERVLESPVTLFPGATITAVTNGGAVRLPNGRVLEFQTRPRAFVPVPGSRYLFVLRRMLEGDFYLITKSIELRDSKVLPNSKDDVARAEEGTWPFLDLDENHVVGEVNRLLLAQKRGAK